MAQDNRLVQEFQSNTFIFDVGVVSSSPGGSIVSLSGLFGGIMPYRQAGDGTLSDALAAVSGIGGTPETDNTRNNPVNRVCLFENEIHNLAGGRWSRQNKTTGDWDVLLDFSDAYTPHRNIGLYPIYDTLTQKRYLFTAYALGSLASSWRVVRYSSDPETMESGSALAVGVNSNTWGSRSEAQLLNKIYSNTPTSPESILIFDGQSLTATRHEIYGVASINMPTSLTPYNGKMYCLHTQTLQALTGVPGGGSGVVAISDVTNKYGKTKQLPFEYLSKAPTVTSEYSDSTCCLFVDNNPVSSSGEEPSLWAYNIVKPQIVPAGGGAVNVEGFSVWQLREDASGDLQVVQQTDALIGGYRAGLFANIGSAYSFNRATISFCDNYPGWFKNSPEKSFMTLRPFGGEPGQTFRQWEFSPSEGTAPNGGADFGGPAKVSFASDSIGGGSRWSPAATSTTIAQDVNIFDIAYASGSLIGDTTWRIFYELMPSTAYHAGTTVNVRWYYDRFHRPTTRCQLTNTSDGTLSNNQVSGIVMNSGVIYYVDWDFSGTDLAEDYSVNLAGLAFIDSADIGAL